MTLENEVNNTPTTPKTRPLNYKQRIALTACSVVAAIGIVKMVGCAANEILEHKYNMTKFADAPRVVKTIPVDQLFENSNGGMYTIHYTDANLKDNRVEVIATVCNNSGIPFPEIKSEDLKGIPPFKGAPKPGSKNYDCVNIFKDLQDKRGYAAIITFGRYTEKELFFKHETWYAGEYGISGYTEIHLPKEGRILPGIVQESKASSEPLHELR